MNSNGLKQGFIKTGTIPLPIASDKNLFDKASEGDWFIAYLYHRVIIGRIKNKQPDFYNPEPITLNNLLKMRIFNTNREVFIWRTNLKEGFKGRIRKDGEGIECMVVDACQIVFGTKAVDLGNGYAKLTEQRGTEVILPLKDLGIETGEINDKIGRLCIKTRNYIGKIPETGQATYNDVRFIEFLKYREV